MDSAAKCHIIDPACACVRACAHWSDRHTSPLLQMWGEQQAGASALFTAWGPLMRMAMDRFWMSRTRVQNPQHSVSVTMQTMVIEMEL